MDFNATELALLITGLKVWKGEFEGSEDKRKWLRVDALIARLSNMLLSLVILDECDDEEE